MSWVKWIGFFFLIEGLANIIYWYKNGTGIKDDNYWQLGRLLRMIFGIILVIFG